MSVGRLRLGRTVCLGLGLVLLACGSVRADVETLDLLPPATPLTAPDWRADTLRGLLGEALSPSTPSVASQEHADPGSGDASGEGPDGVLGTGLLTGGKEPLLGAPDWAATACERSGGGTVILANAPTKLSANESSWLLMFQGFLGVTLFRGRRKWMAALLAAVALSRSGLNAITEWIGLPKTRASRASLPSAPGAGLTARPGLQSSPSQLTYAGLLRRLASDPAADTRRARIELTKPEPATRLASFARVAGFAVPEAVTSPEIRIPAATDFTFLPSEGRVLSPLQTLSFALFARPPPASA